MSQRIARKGFLQAARSLFSRKEYAQSSSWSFNLLDFDLLGKIFGGGTYTNRNVNDDFAMQLSSVWRCITLRSQTIGSLPWAVYERIGPNETREAPEHPLSEVLVQSPNIDMDRMQFRESLSVNLDLRGNAYSLKEMRKNGQVSSLYPMPARQMTVTRDRETNDLVYCFRDRGKEEKYPPEKIWHIRRFSFNGLVGLSPLSYARHAMGLAGATEEFGSRFFANGARVSGTVKIPQWLDDEQRPKALANLERLHTGLDNAHRLMLLEGGMEYEQMSIAPNEAQFLETRKFQVPEICRFFGVPPHLAFDLEHGSYNNVETLAGEWVAFGLLPDLVRIETAAQKQLLPPGDRRKYFVRFNFEGLLRANSQERAMFYSQMLQNGVFSRNEVREKENLNRSAEPGMDDHTVQTNLALIQFLEAMAKAGIANGRGDPSKQAPGAEASAETVAKSLNVSVSPEINVLPESLGREVKAMYERELKAVHNRIQELSRSQEQLGRELIKAQERATWPRKPVYSEAGDLLGVEVVEKL
jgi:HK97 family phage portal protein